MSALEDAAKRWGGAGIVGGRHLARVSEEKPVAGASWASWIETSDQQPTGNTVWSTFVTTAAEWPHSDPNWKGSA
jgi:hypothetical protein